MNGMVTGGIRKARCECTIQKALHGVWSKELADLYLEDLQEKDEIHIFQSNGQSVAYVSSENLQIFANCKLQKKENPSAIGVRFAPSPELVTHGLLVLVFSTGTKCH
jgi:hypothetical protein